MKRWRTRVFLAGMGGRVGSALCEQLEALGGMGRTTSFPAEFCGGANRRWVQWRGVDPVPRTPGDWSGIIDRLARLDRVLFVDCTASEEVSALYSELLAAGIGIVTANKLALSGPLDGYLQLHRLAAEQGVPLRYETTVGAALPVLDSLAALRARGEKLLCLDAALSGTLSFLFSGINRGERFSAVLREAYRRGLTEPHPVEDLLGADLVRKLVILLRESGVMIEPEQVRLEPILPAGCSWAHDPERFFEQSQVLDELWQARAARGPLAALARWNLQTASVEVVQVESDSPFARLGAGANLVCCHTEHYAAQPLVISGPGAGSAITAAGVISDVIQAAYRFDRCIPGVSTALRVGADAPM